MALHTQLKDFFEKWEKQSSKICKLEAVQMNVPSVHFHSTYRLPPVASVVLLEGSSSFD